MQANIIERDDILMGNNLLVNIICPSMCPLQQCRIPAVTLAFGNYMTGYHQFTKHPLKEANWEIANEEIMRFNPDIEILLTASGSHASGGDIKTRHFSLSNKTTKMTGPSSSTSVSSTSASSTSTSKMTMAISSYRLGNKCNAKNIGNIADILEEIRVRNKSFDHYSILAREQNIKYTWYMIPKTNPAVDVTSYEWSIMYKKGGNTIPIGYKTNIINGCRMEIRFSMSSQLWMYIKPAILESCIIARKTIDLDTIQPMSYVTLGAATSTYL